MSQLKSICQQRNFLPIPKEGKEALVAHTASRLLEPGGVTRAAASLQEPWVLALHILGQSTEPVQLKDLIGLLEPGRLHWRSTYRDSFAKLADGLLTSGLVLVEEKQRYGRTQDRYAELRLVVPDVHRPFLPPYPVATSPLLELRPPGQILDFVRDCLIQAGQAARAHDESLRERLISGIACPEGRLCILGSPCPDLPSLLVRLGALWSQGQEHWKTAEYILKQLPEGQGVTSVDLQAALKRRGYTTSKEQVSQFCRDGLAMGLATGEMGCLRALSEPQISAVDAALVFTPSPQGLTVNLDSTGIGPLLELAMWCRASFTGPSTLHLEPDLVLLGRAAMQLDSIACLNTVAQRATVFAKALADVRARHGQILLHKGLLVLKVEDPGLRALLMRQLGNRARCLGGAYLATLRAALPEVEKLAKKQGLCPRNVVA